MICLNCGEEFTPTRCTQKYCSRKCQIKFNSERRHNQRAQREKICLQCGKEILDIHRRRFCSDACRNKYYNLRRDLKIRERKPLLRKICPQCHEEFTPRHGLQKYCSRKCQIKHKLPGIIERQRIKNQAQIAARPKKICPQCHEEFADYYGRKFCSDACRNKYYNLRRDAKIRERKPLSKKICPQCKRKFIPQSETQRYCSVECVKAAYRRGKFKARC